jgi:hypothetical protein
MSDKPIIVVGLVVALAVITVPFWYPLLAGQPDPPPTLVLPEGKCVEKNMRARHMGLLEAWRDAVVRDGEQTYDSQDYPGDSYEMSLTKTCLLQCHGPAAVEEGSATTVRQSFCQQCHDYADVRPNCWDCHLEGSP